MSTKKVKEKAKQFYFFSVFPCMNIKLGRKNYKQKKCYKGKQVKTIKTSLKNKKSVSLLVINAERFL